jgi:hypothetical protein
MGSQNVGLFSALILGCFCALSFAQQEWITFIDQKRTIGPWLEWNREIIARRAVTLRCRIESQAPMAVTLVADRTYQAIQQRDRSAMKREDTVITIDPGPVFERDLAVPRAGSYWFIVENQSDREVEMHLQCSAPRRQSGSSPDSP